MPSWTRRAAIAACLAGTSWLAAAQGYPNRPVKIIVPYVPGGTVDLVARVLAQRLSEQMGQQFVVENRAGASGVIGSDAVAKAAPDGYTLLVQSPTLVANPLMVRKVPYDVVSDFTPITLLGSVPMVMAAHPSVPANNLKEFVAAIKRAAQGLHLRHLGARLAHARGAGSHQAPGQARHPDRHLPRHRGRAQRRHGRPDQRHHRRHPVVGPGHRHRQAQAAGRHHQDAPAVLPNVPTVAESGFPNFEMVSWYGLWGPARLPADVTRRLAEETAKAMKSATVRERLGPQSFIVSGAGPDEFSSYITKEIATYSRVVRDANIQIE
jgi:tripartite-type tricarboxylate transporter receptor subunit TctC